MRILALTLMISSLNHSAFGSDAAAERALVQMHKASQLDPKIKIRQAFQLYRAYKASKKKKKDSTKKRQFRLRKGFLKTSATQKLIERKKYLILNPSTIKGMEPDLNQCCEDLAKIDMGGSKIKGDLHEKDTQFTYLHYEVKDGKIVNGPMTPDSTQHTFFPYQFKTEAIERVSEGVVCRMLTQISTLYSGGLYLGGYVQVKLVRSTGDYTGQYDQDGETGLVPHQDGVKFLGTIFIKNTMTGGVPQIFKVPADFKTTCKDTTTQNITKHYQSLPLCNKLQTLNPSTEIGYIIDENATVIIDGKHCALAHNTTSWSKKDLDSERIVIIVRFF